MTPIIFIVNGLSTGLLMLLRIDPNAKDNTMTEAELRSVVNVSHQDGVIESDEKEMIYNVFDLRYAIANDDHGSPCQRNILRYLTAVTMN